MPVSSVVEKVKKLAESVESQELQRDKAKALPIVEITGGEPLAQKASIVLMENLVSLNYQVLLETSGSISVENVPDPVVRIVDVKGPSSGEDSKNLWTNFEFMHPHDEVKFVCGTVEDVDYLEKVCREFDLFNRFEILVSWVAPLEEHQMDKSLKAVPSNLRPISQVELVEYVLSKNLPVRFQLQMHKYIWPQDMKGV